MTVYFVLSVLLITFHYYTFHSYSYIASRSSSFVTTKQTKKDNFWLNR